MNYDYSETIEFLIDWYNNNARILPWRENPIPYYVLVSEIMLQQTRVEAVKSYFDRFIKALPDIESLGMVEEEKLLKLWEGLGYYNRARNLQKAAIMVREEYNGELPADYKELLKLPGVGSYTAGAVASIAFGIPEPAVDGNVLRVMKRVASSFDDITSLKVRRTLEEDLRAIMPKIRPGDFNQAIMELGATICIPNGKPLCLKCPIMHLCKAYKNKTEMLIPVKPPKKARKIEEKTVLLFKNNDEYGLRKRENKGLLAGLWELPSIEGKLNIEALEELFKSKNIRYEEIIPMGDSKHIFSHIEWHMTGYKVILKEEMMGEKSIYEGAKEKDIQYELKENIEKIYSLPSAFEHYKKQM